MTNDERLAAAARLRAFIRDVHPGACKMLTQGDACTCPLCDIDLLSALPVAERAQPILWRWKKRINCGQGQFIESHWIITNENPNEHTEYESVLEVQPLYAVPPPAAQPAVPEGFVLVPKEPTDAMLVELFRGYRTREKAYAAMLAAAPGGEWK